MNDLSTICAIATPGGKGAIAVIRMSGAEAIQIATKIFKPMQSGKDLTLEKGHTLHYGTIMNDTVIVDDVLISIFKAPHSYTGENSIEISCHASPYIQQQIMQLLLNLGCRLANPGEFTQRAFLNGKMDLSQAEAVADLIASDSAMAHRTALQQMRGGFSQKLKALREQLLNITSLIELELDFGDEDVVFADRTQLKALLDEIRANIEKLVASFSVGNAIKNGIPCTILGKPNTGKSTLLNALLNDERAIVSDIAGTTRDVIEDVVHIEGVSFRFIDTAGLRHTTDEIESIGIRKAYEKLNQASIILYIINGDDNENETIEAIQAIQSKITNEQKMVVLINKIDKLSQSVVAKLREAIYTHIENDNIIEISAKMGAGLDVLKTKLVSLIHLDSLSANDVVVTNLRHQQSLIKSLEFLARVENGLLLGVSGDFLSQDIRETILHLSVITGDISNHEVLGNIFKNFCIGK